MEDLVSIFFLVFNLVDATKKNYKNRIISFALKK